MSGSNRPQTPEAMLQRAIEQVLRAASGWLILVIILSLLALLLSFAILMNKLQLISKVPQTLSAETAESVAVFWLIGLATMAALRALQHYSIGSMARYAAQRLAVPAALAAAQRAGRPETLSAEVVNDIEQLRTALASSATSSALNFIITPVLLALVAYMQIALGIMALAYCILATILSLLLARASEQAAVLSGQANARAYGHAADAMRSGEAVLSMGMLPALAREWVALSTAGGGEAWLAERRAERLRTALEFLMGTFRGASMGMMAFFTISGISVHAAIAGGVMLVGMVVMPYVGIGAHAKTIAEAAAAWKRLRKLVDEGGAQAEGLAYPCPEGRLVVERMSFAFRGPNPPILRNIDLVVEPGEIVAIVGASGSGKSTLLRLLMGVMRPSIGGIYLDGHATHQWDRRDLARHVGYLPQDSLLSRGTVEEVIARLEMPQPGLVLDAAKRAQAHEAIIALPHGYATPLLQSHQLSMGQRQRIALARALYGRPKLLILDELAGSLDAEGEAGVATLLQVLREERTSVIFTTHRPNLLAVADRVLALRNGTLVPAGEDQARLPGRGRAVSRPRSKPAREAAA
ncbi:ATP-binding cassette domain-containing protein [Siccirubricoccus sp. KC 17139]|uniref:ATP-binding cassette domain-containing protein n=1 Tax=Siccirubricoccus soli TaxID=2899147 RepID=A0ABT1D882_9PROT|nr:ATP-binding cassette domain-containing protein [Siccirubricoccus soli]MCO6417180.1 ATP-binding cassette domain-containing protein [Siccirubricoccus soli]MCP2683315.1 ATP-binding cassette domain-containing protein [Siccirubricoccus soli]